MQAPGFQDRGPAPFLETIAMTARAPKTVVAVETAPTKPPYSDVRLPVVLPDTLPPPIAGKTILMQKFTTRDFIGIRGNAWNELQMMQRTLEAIIEYVPGHDPLDLAPEQLFDVMGAWIAAKLEDALPPVNA